jgi:transglutaminase-like putative cysteine protease
MKKIFTWDMPISILAAYALTYCVSFLFVVPLAPPVIFLCVLMCCLLYSVIAAYAKYLLRALLFLPVLGLIVWFFRLYESYIELFEAYHKWIWAVAPHWGFEFLTASLITLAVSVPVFILVRCRTPAPVLLLVGGTLFAGMEFGGMAYPEPLFWGFALAVMLQIAHTSGRKLAPFGLRLLAALPVCLVAVIAASMFTTPETDPLRFIREFRLPNFNTGIEGPFPGRGNATYITGVGRELGGPFRPTGQLMLTVYAGIRNAPYLRGGVGIEYDGRRWHDGRLVGYSVPADRLMAIDIVDIDMNSYSITHEGLRGNRLYLPYGTKNLFSFDWAGDLTWHTGDVLRLTNPGAGLTYLVHTTVRSGERVIPFHRPPGLQFPEDYLPDYLQLPQGIPFRISQLARSLAVYGDDYYNALAIERYLVENYIYNPDMDRTPEGRDFVDYFLFEQQEGYCTYFATAMVVLCRSVGLPARYVDGFAPASERNENGVFQYTDERAHAWVEVFLRGSGWVQFEPTPGYNMVETVIFPEPITPERPSPPPDLPSPRPPSPPPGLPSPPPEGPVSGRPDGTDDRQIPWRLILAFALPPPVLFAVWLALRIRRKHFMQMVAAAPYDQKAVKRIYRHLLWLVSHANVKPHPYETLNEFAARVDEAWPTKLYIMRRVADVYSKSCYADTPLTTEESETLKQYVHIFERREHIHLGAAKYTFYSKVLSLLPVIKRVKYDRYNTFE